MNAEPYFEGCHFCVVAQGGEYIEDGAVEDDFTGLDHFIADGLRKMALAQDGRADLGVGPAQGVLAHGNNLPP